MSDRPDNNAIRFRLISVDSLRLAVPEDRITTVGDWSEPTPLPFGPKTVLGVVCIQGRMFTVVNLIKLLRPEGSARHTGQLIVALRGDEQLALAVDSVAGLVALPATQITAVEPDATNLTNHAFEFEGNRWLVLNVDELFNSLVQGRERRRRRT